MPLPDVVLPLPTNPYLHTATRLQDVTAKVNLDKFDANLLAIADYDGDSAVDLIAAHHRTIQAHLWSADAQRFETPDHSTSWQLETPPVAIVPGDFSRDGRFDSVVLFQHSHCDGLLSLSQCNHTFGCAPIPPATDQITAAWLNGTDGTLLFGGFANATDSTGAKGCAAGGGECDPSADGPAASPPGCCACGFACAAVDAGGAKGKCVPAESRPYAWSLGDGVAANLTNPWASVIPGSDRGSEEGSSRGGTAPSSSSGASRAASPILESLPPQIVLAAPNANAQVDLDGDCVADLLVVAAGSPAERSCLSRECHLLVFLQQRGPAGSPRWTPTPQYNVSLPVGAGQIAVADLDSDGLIDLIFTSSTAGESPAVHVWYTVEADSQAAAATAAQQCKPPRSTPRALCAGGRALAFLKRRFELPKRWELLAPEPLPARPPTLSVADFDLNGYPDVLLSMVAPADAASGLGSCVAGQPCVVLLYNDQKLRCYNGSLPLYNSSLAIDAGDNADARIFPTIGGATSAVFFDLHSDGLWDVLAMHKGGTLSAWRRMPTGGEYFLKATTTDGSCVAEWEYYLPGELPDEAGVGGGDEDGDELGVSRRAGDKRYPGACVTGADSGGRLFARGGRQASVHQPGVSYQFITSLPTQWSQVATSAILSWHREKVVRSAVQLPQSGYSALQTPYVLLGLGTTNDYVESLMIGMPAGYVRHFDQAVLPNSHLMIIPHPVSEPRLWEMQLYLEPRQHAMVAVAASGVLLFLGLIIGILELHERRLDARENKALRPALPL